MKSNNKHNKCLLHPIPNPIKTKSGFKSKLVWVLHTAELDLLNSCSLCLHRKMCVRCILQSKYPES